MEKIILASTSPRRHTLLEMSGIDFEIVPSDYEEDMSIAMSPEELAKHLSHGKAHDVGKNYRNHIIIAADTFIVHDDTLLGKPHTPEKAVATLETLSGSMISVVSGVTVLDTKRDTLNRQSITTTARVKDLSSKEITDYVETGEPLDCAGAFNIFKKGRFIIEKIDGSYTNIMGLPMETLEEMLAKYNITFAQDTEQWLKNELGCKS